MYVQARAYYPLGEVSPNIKVKRRLHQKFLKYIFNISSVVEEDFQ
jgi:hypothetical protein